MTNFSDELYNSLKPFKLHEPSDARRCRDMAEGREQETFETSLDRDIWGKI